MTGRALDAVAYALVGAPWVVSLALLPLTLLAVAGVWCYDTCRARGANTGESLRF